MTSECLERERRNQREEEKKEEEHDESSMDKRQAKDAAGEWA